MRIETGPEPKSKKEISEEAEEKKKALSAKEKAFEESLTGAPEKQRAEDRQKELWRLKAKKESATAYRVAKAKEYLEREYAGKGKSVPPGVFREMDRPMISPKELSEKRFQAIKETMGQVPKGRFGEYENVEPKKLSYDLDGGKKGLAFLLSTAHLAPAERTAIEERLADPQFEEADLAILRPEMDADELKILERDLRQGRLDESYAADLKKDAILESIERAEEFALPSAERYVKRIQLARLSPEKAQKFLDGVNEKTRQEYNQLKETVRFYDAESALPDYDEIVNSPDPEKIIGMVGLREFGMHQNTKSDQAVDPLTKKLYDKFQGFAYTAEAVRDAKRQLQKRGRAAGRQTAA